MFVFIAMRRHMIRIFILFFSRTNSVKTNELEKPITWHEFGAEEKEKTKRMTEKKMEQNYKLKMHDGN